MSGILPRSGLSMGALATSCSPDLNDSRVSRVCKHVVTLIGIGVTVACSSSSSDSDIGAVLSRLAEGKAVYGYSYEAAPPDGQKLRVGVFDVATASQACEIYQTAASNIDEFWYLKLEFGAGVSGDYSVVTASNAETTTGTVSLIRVKSGAKKEIYRGQTGTMAISLDSSADAGQLDMDVAFATETGAVGECSATGSTTSTEVSRSCTCTMADGSTTTCIPEESEDCCLTVTASGKTETLKASMQIAYCSYMCIWSQPELAGYCAS